jgi:hypothetical protein
MMIAAAVKQRGFVDVIARLVEHRRCRGNRCVEARRIDDDAVTGAELLISLAPERGTGIDQREIHIEEDCPYHAGAGVAGRAPGS